MSDTEQTVDTAECVEIVRALVKAFQDKGQPLERRLRDAYQPESYLYPWRVEVSTKLVERGLRALGMPTPEVPQPRKIPAMPSDAQARVLDYLNAREDARLKGWSNYNGSQAYNLMRPEDDYYNDETKVTKGTHEKLWAYKWIEFDRRDGKSYRPKIYYKLTDAGREVLTRYQEKLGVI